jgi:hypothetical protein
MRPVLSVARKSYVVEALVYFTDAASIEQAKNPAYGPVLAIDFSEHAGAMLHPDTNPPIRTSTSAL